MNSSFASILNNIRVVDSILYRCKILWRFVGFELVVWVIGISYLIFLNTPGDSHFTFCPLANMGIKFCPGCGLGNSISYLFRGDFVSSLHSHPLGIFAFIIILARIISLIINNRRRYA